MATALDVARYFLGRADRDAGDAPTHLWVQKQVYYAQAWSLVFLGKPLFEDQVEAWENGPVVYSVWKEYKRYERSVIAEESVNFEQPFRSSELSVLNATWERYGGLTAGRLWKLTHCELPWAHARLGLEPSEPSRNPISSEDMRVYYGDFGGVIDGRFFIEKRVVDLDKDKTIVTVCMTDGTQKQVNLKDLGTFVSGYSGMIEYEQSSLPAEGVELF